MAERRHGFAVMGYFTDDHPTEATVPADTKEETRGESTYLLLPSDAGIHRENSDIVTRLDFLPKEESYVLAPVNDKVFRGPFSRIPKENFSGTRIPATADTREYGGSGPNAAFAIAHSALEGIEDKIMVGVVGTRNLPFDELQAHYKTTLDVLVADVHFPLSNNDIVVFVKDGKRYKRVVFKQKDRDSVYLSPEEKVEELQLHLREFIASGSETLTAYAKLLETNPKQEDAVRLAVKSMNEIIERKFGEYERIFSDFVYDGAHAFMLNSVKTREERDFAAELILGIYRENYTKKPEDKVQIWLAPTASLYGKNFDHTRFLNYLFYLAAEQRGTKEMNVILNHQEARDVVEHCYGKIGSGSLYDLAKGVVELAGNNATAYVTSSKETKMVCCEYNERLKRYIVYDVQGFTDEELAKYRENTEPKCLNPDELFVNGAGDATAGYMMRLIRHSNGRFSSGDDRQRAECIGDAMMGAMYRVGKFITMPGVQSVVDKERLSEFKSKIGRKLEVKMFAYDSSAWQPLNL